MRSSTARPSSDRVGVSCTSARAASACLALSRLRRTRAQRRAQFCWVDDEVDCGDPAAGNGKRGDGDDPAPRRDDHTDAAVDEGGAGEASEPATAAEYVLHDRVRPGDGIAGDRPAAAGVNPEDD